ncbi:MAG: DUF2066 domain-containing protein [Hyphomonadaceae bacterium]
MATLLGDGGFDRDPTVARDARLTPDEDSMSLKSLAGIAAFVAAAFCAFAPIPASAQGRESVYAVSGVRVEASAANSTEARAQAFELGQRLAFERLVRRVTVPDELTRVGMPRPDAAAIEQLVASVDVQEERRSGTRYLGRLAVRFRPAAVQTLLRQSGLAVADTRGPAVLVAPLVTNVTVEAADAWRQVWEQGGYGEELVPLLAAPRSLVGNPDWIAAAPHAQAAGANRVLYLDLRQNGPNVTAAVVEVGPGGLRRDRGTVQARVAEGDQGLVTALTSLADQANARIQTEWKTSIATSSGQRARVSASALYANQGEWQRIKSGLEAAAATLISEIRIEAVARPGALVSFSFVGDRQALAAELRRHSVILEETQQGPVLRVASR